MKKPLPPEHNISKPRNVLAVTGLAVGAVIASSLYMVPQQDAERTATSPVSDKQVEYTAKSIAQLPHTDGSDGNGRYEVSISKHLANVQTADSTNYDIRMTSSAPDQTPKKLQLKNILAITCTIETVGKPDHSGSVTLAPDPQTGNWFSQSTSLATEDDQFCFAVINQVATS